ncbi:hypothetical protein BCR44DRAFT_1443730 [Catenaria anguillulae PL171]|uniref:Uncharacterized protein n=1 Tax=Catenaria anguillulae PL171 TaxID=765915 RepID=A0A1Y2H8D2_9FUNG|nr:hypothetical protein BCR44DRAFT_1443730 [Catenaria anguillulae PL171]
MLLLAKIGHVDVTHLPAIAPNLTQLDLDVDHVDGLPTLLAHPSLKLLLLTGVRCPTALEALLAHDFSSSHGPTIQLQRPLIGSMYMGSGESMVGSMDVCAREDIVLEYSRERTDVWRALASQDYVAMPQGNVAKVTLSVPWDVRVAESRVLVAAILRVVDGWKGMVFKVRLLGNRKCQRGGRSNVPHGVGVLVQGLRATPGLTRLLVQLNPSARWKVVHSGWKVGAFGKSRRRGLLAF